MTHEPDETITRVRGWATSLADIGVFAGRLAHDAADSATLALHVGDVAGYVSAMTRLGELQIRLGDLARFAPLLDDDPPETTH